MTIKRNPNQSAYNEISKAIKDNEGYCVCALEKTKETQCVCKDFQDQVKPGFCHCGRYYKIDKYPIITLCGSTRFKEEFLKVQQTLTINGWIVLNVGVFGHADSMPVVATPQSTIKGQLDDMHKAKIEMSDAIYVINKNGYIGESTRSEIEWAEELGKEIYYLEEKGE